MPNVGEFVTCLYFPPEKVMLSVWLTPLWMPYIITRSIAPSKPNWLALLSNKLAQIFGAIQIYGGFGTVDAAK